MARLESESLMDAFARSLRMTWSDLRQHLRQRLAVLRAE
jgi:hypothetical protein